MVSAVRESLLILTGVTGSHGGSTARHVALLNRFCLSK